MFKNSRGLLFAAFTALTLSACGGGSVGGGDGGDPDPGNPGGGTSTVTGIDITVGASQATPGQSVLVRATLTGTGTLSGRTVTFSTTAGTFSPSATDSTNTSGIAERTLIAPNQSGAITVTVSSAGFSSSETITVVPGPVVNVDVEPLPNLVPLGGVSRVQALVTDAFDNPVPNVTVRFTAFTNNTVGRFAAGNTAVTDTNGFARVDYTAGTTAGTDTLRATATGGVFGSAPLNANAANAAPGSIQLTLNRTNLQAGGASATATAFVADEDGNPIQGVTVGFSATGGSIPSSAVTNVNGRASVAYTPPPTGGTFRLRAEIGAFNDEQVVVVAQSPQTIAAIDLQLSSNDLSSNAQSAATGVQVTATVLDANNGVVPNQSVSFTASSGVLTPLGTTGTANNVPTDGAGQARAVLTVGSNPRNRPITVTVRAGSVTSTVVVNVVGTRFATIDGPSALRAGATEGNTYTVRLQDADSNGIVGQQVRFLAFEDGSATPLALGTATTVSNPRGEASIALTPRAGVNQLRLVAELVTQAGETPLRSAEFLIVVNNRTLSFLETGVGSSSLDQIPINTDYPVVVSLRQASGSTTVPAINQVIRLSVTRGAVTSALQDTTDANGLAQFTIRGSNTGPVTLTALTVADGLTVSRQTSYVSTAPDEITLQASPATIGTNSTSEIRATVRDADGNRVVGQTVNFSIVTDPTNGSLSATTAVTNDVGIASVNYRASSVASAKDGVVLRAFIVAAPGVVPASVTLTVGNQALRIALGTSNVIEKDGDTLYKLPYVATVKDSAGNPVPEAEFTLNVRPLFYRKGRKVFNVPVWQVEDSAMTCRAEDVNDDGILDTGEDINSNGILDPSDGVNVPRTLELRESDATVEFDVTYPRDRSNWVVVELTAIARVAGSEAVEKAIFTLPMSADDAEEEEVAPPGQISPFGVVRDCTVADTGAYAKITTTRQAVNEGAAVSIMVNLEGTANKDVTVPLFATVGTSQDAIDINFDNPTNGNANITIPAGQLTGTASFTFSNDNTAGRIIPVTISIGKPVNAEIGSPASVIIDVRP